MEEGDLEAERARQYDTYRSVKANIGSVDCAARGEVVAEPWSPALDAGQRRGCLAKHSV